MSITSIKIPQIGEGLQEARVVALLKNPGDPIRRDEPIYQMETDKAVMDVESPVDGTLLEWMVQVDEVVAIGAEVAKVESEKGASVAESKPSSGEAASGPEDRPKGVIPPKTRAYAKEKGISEDELGLLSAKYEKLLPEHIDTHLSKPKQPRRNYTELPLSPKQRILNSRMQRGAQLVVPGTVMVTVDWEAIDREKRRLRSGQDGFQPSAFTIFAYAVTQAVKKHPKLKTSLVGEDMYRTYAGLSLGIAVGLPEDELALAVVEQADLIGWHEFATRMKDAIDRARAGEDQAHEAVTLSLTNMQSFGLRSAVPVVVPPAVATLFLGETYSSVHEEEGDVVARKACNLSMTFDHRVMNGVGAAQFVDQVKKNVEHIERLLTYES